jgi:hypothetical protein
MYANVDVEQPHGGLSTEEDTTAEFLPEERMTLTVRRVAGVGLGLIALVACAALALVSAATMTDKKDELSIRELLEHADVHESAANNIMKIHQEWFGQPPSVWQVRRLTEQTFRNASQVLANKDPETANQKVSLGEKAAVVRALSYLSDRRVQKLGYDVAKAVKVAAKQYPDRLNDPAKLKKHIAQTLGEKKLGEIRLLRDEIFPDELAKKYAKGGGFEHLLNPKRIQFMSNIDDKWEEQFKLLSSEDTSAQERRMQGYSGGWGAPAGQTGAAGYSSAAGFAVQTTTDHNLGTSEAVLGILGAAAEEANALVRIIRPMGKVMGNDLNVDPLATSGIGAAAFVLEAADCEINAAMDQFNPIEMAGCPLEYGSEGFDACREFLAMAGILGDNNPKNGEQGNHNGEKESDDEHIIPGVGDNRRA